MEVTSSKIEKRTAYLTIEMEPAEVEEYMGKAYKNMVDKVDIPGFRKGNAPRDVFEKHVGRDKLLEEAKKELIPKTYNAVVKEQELKPLMRPMVKVTQEEPLIFDIVVPLVPTVEIGDYRSIRMQPEPVEVTDKDIDAVIEQIRQQGASHKPVDRPIKTGDIATINIKGIAMESPFLNNPMVQVRVTPEFPPEIPGLSDHFIGMKKDEEKEFTLRLPEDYPTQLLAGKEATFIVKVFEVKEESLPELDDKLAKIVSPEIKTLDALKERIAENMKIEYEQRAKNNFEEKLITALIERSNIEVSPLTIESETKFLLQQSLQQLQSECKTKEEYEEKLKQVSMEKVEERCREMAERRIHWNLVLSEVAKAEKIGVSDEEITVEIEKKIQEAMGQVGEEQLQYLNDPQYREDAKSMITARKTFKFLTDIANSPDEDKDKEKAKSKKRKEAK